MILYTPPQINELITLARCNRDIVEICDYLDSHKHIYTNDQLFDWVEDIRLLMILFKTQ